MKIEEITREAFEEIAERYRLEVGVVESIIRDYDRLLSCYFAPGVIVYGLN